MLTISFQGHPEAQAIIVDKLVNGVSGIVECAVCNCHTVLVTSGIKETSDEIERFIKNHKCALLARREEVIAFGAKLAKNLPEHSVKLMKGGKLIKEF